MQQHSIIVLHATKSEQSSGAGAQSKIYSLCIASVYV